MNEDQIEREIQKTLDLLVPTPQVKPRPFFYTRLKARMEQPPRFALGKVHRRFRGAILAIAAVALLVALNAYSLMKLATRGTETQSQETIASFAQEYSLTSTRY